MQEKLKEINKQAAMNASMALSKLINRPVGIEIPRAEVKRVEELRPLLGLGEIVAGIYLPVTGDIKGAALLVIPKESAFTMSDLLVKRKPGTTRKLTELDESALKEVGNIISGNYLTILSNILQVKVIEHLPSFSFDMFGAIVSQIIVEFARKVDKALVIELEFVFKPEILKGYFILLFEVEQFKALIGSLGEA